MAAESEDPDKRLFASYETNNSSRVETGNKEYRET